MSRSFLSMFASATIVLTLTLTSSAQNRTDPPSGIDPGSQAMTPELLRANPWVKAKKFPDTLARESSVKELGDLIEGLQNAVITHGLNRRMSVQTGTSVDENAPPPTKVEDIHCSRLVGIEMRRQNDGSYLMEVYLEVASPFGETKYHNTGAMAYDGVPPVETIRLEGHRYTHTVHGVAYSATF